jgi:hypothetical protein
MAMTNIRIAVAIIRVVVAIIRTVWHAVARVTRAVWHAITFVVRQAVNRVRSVVNTINRVVGIFRRVWGLVRSVTVGLWDGIKRAIAGAVEWIVSKIEWVWDKIKGAADAIGGIFGGGSEDGARVGKGGRRGRGFASGGYIPATRGGRSIIAGEGGEGEWVVPASKKRAFAEAVVGKGSNSQVVNISIGNVNGTDRQAARSLAGMVKEELMRDTLRQMVGQNA